jgi:hypothetical protein
MTSVTFFITDDTKPTGIPLEGAIVRVFSLDGETFVTQGTTDEDGELVLELEDDTTYWVRFFKVSYEFPTRLTIEVDSSQGNEFDVVGTDLMEHPPSANEFLCRASGYVRSGDWAPEPGIKMTFMLTGKPRIVAGQIMVGGDIITESDETGWIEIELVQGGSYDVIVQGLEDSIIRVQVPEKQACSITELIWPYVQSLEYGSPSLSLAVGSTATISASVTLSSGVQTPFTMDSEDVFVAGMFVLFTVEDEAVCAVTWDEDDNLIVEGIKAGTTTVTAEVKADAEAPRLPEPERDIATLSITVTE